MVGTSLLDSKLLSTLEETTVDTDREPVTVHRTEDLVVRQRHASPEGYRPPHRINHKANVSALDELGVETILSVQSTGSLQPEIEPGDFVVPDDFINPWAPVSFYDDERGHGVRTFSNSVREAILDGLDGMDGPVRDGGVYVQTLGPRFETPAEARMLADYGDLVGMTAGSEVTLAGERGLDYATLCMVDNYVNGIAGTEIDMESFQASVDEHHPRVIRALEQLLDEAFNLSLPGGIS